MLRNVDWYSVTDVYGPLKIGPVVCPETPVTTKLRRVTSQKSEYLIHTAAEN